MEEESGKLLSDVLSLSAEQSTEAEKRYGKSEKNGQTLPFDDFPSVLKESWKKHRKTEALPRSHMAHRIRNNG